MVSTSPADDRELIRSNEHFAKGLHVVSYNGQAGQLISDSGTRILALVAALDRVIGERDAAIADRDSLRAAYDLAMRANINERARLRAIRSRSTRGTPT